MNHHWRISSTIVNDSLCLPTASSKPFREIYIPWPNTSVRFLLNETSNKQRLESLIHDFPLTLSVSQSEYDPKIAFIVWGPHLEVITAEQKLQAFLEQLTTDIETVEVSLSTDQTNFLLNEACVFEHIEAIYGVHAELHQHYENKWDRALYTSFDFDPVPYSEPDRSFSLQTLNGSLIQILIVCTPLRELDNKAPMIEISDAEESDRIIKLKFSLTGEEMTMDPVDVLFDRKLHSFIYTMLQFAEIQMVHEIIVFSPDLEKNHHHNDMMISIIGHIAAFASSMSLDSLKKIELISNMDEECKVESDEGIAKTRARKLADRLASITSPKSPICKDPFRLMTPPPGFSESSLMKENTNSRPKILLKGTHENLLQAVSALRARLEVE